MTSFALHRSMTSLLSMAVLIASTAQLSCAQSSAGSELRLAQPGSPDGVGHYVPGSWSTLRFRVANPADHDAEGLVGAFFSHDLEQQFFRRLWVPPHATRVGWLPVLTPRATAANVKQAEIKSFLLETTGPSEVLVPQRGTEKLYSAPVALERLPVRVVTVTDLDSTQHDECKMWMEAFSAVQIKQFGSAQLIELPQDFLPVLPDSLKTTSGLVVMGNRLVHDPAGMQAIRQWINDGGSLWIMLDLVELSTAHLLLGDAFQSLIVDRTKLSTVEFERPNGASVNLPLREFDPPVDLVRVEVPGAEVMHTVNGWPVSMQVRLGRGRVMCTTLDVRAWVEPRNDVGQRAGLDPTLKYELTEPIAEIFRRFFEPTEPAILSAEKLESFVTQQIGYEILDRSRVLAVLGSFCAGLLVAGLWLKRRGRLESMLWVLPLAALVAAVPLALAAELNRRAVTPTIAVAQVMEVERDRSTATVIGLAAMYEPQPWTAPLTASRHGILMPVRTDLGGSIRRMIWTDLDSFHWDNLRFPAGVSLATFQFPQQFEQPLNSRIQFGPNALTGTFSTGQLTHLADGLIATDSQRVLGLHILADGSYQAETGDVLAPQQFVAGTILSDEQRRRKDVLTRVLNAEGRSTKYPEFPTLLVWARPIDMPFAFPLELQQIGSLLAALPVIIEPPEPGSQLLIPSPFLSCRAVAGPDSGGASVSFDNRKRQWPEQSRATDTWLRFQLPAEVLPIVLEQATLTFNVSAPLRTIELSTGAVNNMVPLDRRSDLVGTFTYNIQQPGALQLDASGGLHVRLNVGEIALNSANGREAGFLENRWKVEALELEVRARSLSRDASSRP